MHLQLLYSGSGVITSPSCAHELYSVRSHASKKWRTSRKHTRPTLFSIYVNDLPSIPQYCSPQCYVDDTKLLLSFALHEERGLRDKINQDLLKIRNWCFNTQLLLNPDKTKLMIFGSRQNIAKVNDDFNLSLFGKDLVPATTAKDLGVIMDPNLTFGNHVPETTPASFLTNSG